MPQTEIQTVERAATEVAPRAFMVGAALFLVGVVGITYWADRVHRRWWKENRPFAGTIARYERMGTTYRDRRANVSEVAEVFGEIFSEVSRALEAK